MKKLYFVILLLLFSINAKSQVWIDSGAVWHYDYWNVGEGGFFKYTYSQDSLIEGKNCQMITGEIYRFCQNQFGNVVLLGHQILNNEFTYVSGDTVFYQNNGQFFVLFNFGAAIGDKWVVATTNPFGVCDDTSRIEVTGVGNINIQSVNYRTITIQPTSNSPIGLKGTFVERFGNIDQIYAPFQGIFPYIYQCDSLQGIYEFSFLKFKCFSDNTFSLYNPSSEDCEYHLTYLGIDENERKQIRIYPNPFTESTIIEFENNNSENYFLEIFNNLGQKVRRIDNIRTNKIIIEGGNLNSGIYFFQLKNDSGISQTGKLVVE